MIPVIGGINLDGEGSAEILLSDLDAPFGYHTVYVEAVDTEGYIGPVSTARFEVTELSDPLIPKSVAPSAYPSTQPASLSCKADYV